MKKYFLCFLIAFTFTEAQSITGLTGLVSVPTAEINGDGKLTFGISYFDKNYLSLYNKNYNGVAFYTSLSFLPFVELGFRFTRLLDYPEAQALGDRMPSIRIRVIKESNVFPSILFGAHDFLRTSESKSSYNSATYLAATKNFNMVEDVIDIKLNIGHGFKLIKSSGYQFEQLFYGVSIALLKNYELMFENDSKSFNAGVKFSMYNIALIACLMDMKNFSSTVSYSFQL